MRERTRASMWSYILVYNVLIYLLPLKSTVFVVPFSNIFRHWSETFAKGSFKNEIFPFLAIFFFPYSIYRGVKICFYLCRYQNQNISLVLHSCCSCSTCVTLMLDSCFSCLTRVARVALVSYSCCSCRTRVAPVWRLCCKLD